MNIGITVSTEFVKVVKYYSLWKLDLGVFFKSFFYNLYIKFNPEFKYRIKWNKVPCPRCKKIPIRLTGVGICNKCYDETMKR